MYVQDVCGIQSEVVYSIKHCVLIWFGHVYLLGFQPTHLNLGQGLLW